MNQGSSLARVQQAGTLLLLAGGAAWFAWQWPSSPGAAVAGLLLCWFGYSLVLAFEFLVLRLVDGDESSVRATWSEIARAWLAETWLNAVIFAWRQPFRWNAVPDHVPARTAAPRRGVVLIHGFACNRGVWTPWLRELQRRGIPFVAVNLEPAFGPIENYGSIIEDAVQRVTQATGIAPVLLCHSMGGIAARAWMRARSGEQRVHHVITIGSPHRGTWFGRYSHAANGRQMAWQCEWLRELGAALPANGGALFTCWYSNCDNMVFPVETATLPGADNRLVRGPAHVELAFHPRVMAESLAIIER